MVALSYIKRKNAEKAQGQFWRYASGAEEIQTKWFEELLGRDDHILLTSEEGGKIYSKNFQNPDKITSGENDEPSELGDRVQDPQLSEAGTEKAKSIKGFVIGRLIKAPEVYDPGGLTLMIDDFCVTDNKWDEIASGLIAEIKILAKEKGASQILVVSGAWDITKKDFLTKIGLSVASEWFVGGI